MSKSSFVLVDAQLLADKSAETMRRIESIREKKDKAYIEKIVRKTNGRWWRKLFKSTPVTFEQAKKELESSENLVWFDYPSVYAWGNYGAACLLNRAANDTLKSGGKIDNQIRVCIEDWDLIQ